MNALTLSASDVRISRALSKILRHKAREMRLPIRDDGFLLIQELLRLNQFKGIVLDDIRRVVDNNDKKRFELSEIEGSLYIRACQGHTMDIDDDQLLEKIHEASEIPICIHGTYFNFLSSIRSNGLSKMKRNHIHMATGLPNEVVSGARKGCEVLIYINVSKAMADGIIFYRSKNGVILSSGINGILDPKYFSSIKNAKTLEEIV